MSVEAFIYSYLSAATDLSTLVSTRIYPGRAPQNVAYPYIRYFLVSESPLHTFEGTDTLRWYDFQFSCFSDTYAGSVAVRDALVYVFDGVSGFFPFGSPAITYKAGVQHTRSTFLYETETQSFHQAIDFQISLFTA